MDFIQSIRTCFSKYATFTGRASRSEFWYFQLFLFLGYIALTYLFLLSFLQHFYSFQLHLAVAVATLILVFSVAILLPEIAVTTRRLHDFGYSGLWQLLYLMGCGWFVLVMCAQKSQDSENLYGLPEAGDELD